MTEVPKRVLDHDLSGRAIGDYRILRRLGRGAMAEVYLAEQTSLKRQVAVKVLLAHLAADANYVERFRREAQAAAALVHANIVQIHEVGRAGDIHYIVQEYVVGQNLREYQQRHGDLTAQQAVRIMRQVAAALNKAAMQGVVHRDIKPENIMLSPTGEVKVADFGLARVLNDTAANLTEVGITMGTPLYMSPEQFDGRSLDPRSDLYSLGATCYHMLAGRPPFEAETALGIAVQHMQTPPEPLEHHRPDLPPALCEIVTRMLAKNPADRFASGRELIKSLNVLQINDIEDDWAQDVDTEDGTAGAATQAATQHLAQVLAQAQSAHDQSLLARRSLLTAIALTAVVLLGWGLGRWISPPFLLDSADPTRTHVEKQANVVDQLFYASALNTEEGWLSIRQYFPDDPFYDHLADQQLARLYLHREDYERARQKFEQLANLDDAEESFRAFGLAGLCIVYSLTGNPQQSAEQLSKLYPLRQELDQQMMPLVELAVQRNQQALSPTKVRDWTNWIKEHTTDENEADPVGPTN